MQRLSLMTDIVENARREMEVNYFAPLNLIRHTLPALVAHGEADRHLQVGVAEVELTEPVGPVPDAGHHIDDPFLQHRRQLAPLHRDEFGPHPQALGKPQGELHVQSPLAIQGAAIGKGIRGAIDHPHDPGAG